MFHRILNSQIYNFITLYYVYSQVSIGSTHSRSSRVPAASYNPRTPSREFRISRAYPEWSDSEMEAEGMHDPVADSMSMLATTISCVMLLAAGVHQIPEEYYIWTERYLDCMRDPQMRYPPNILGILNHIEMLRQGKKDPPPTEKPCKQKDKKDSSARSPCPKTSPCAKTSKGISPDDSSIICDTGSQMRTSKI